MTPPADATPPDEGHARAGVPTPHAHSPSPVFVLLGPTASGKTAVSLSLAEALGADIVALDSKQLFRGMAVGTAQPTPQELARVRHHLFGVLDPFVPFTAGDYGRLARRTLADIEAEGGRALFVGGSGLYLAAFLGALDDDLPGDPALRTELQRRAREEGSAALHQELARLDPERAAALHPNDAHRIVRALEVVRLTGRPMGAAGATEPPGPSPAPRQFRPGGAPAGDAGHPAHRVRIVVLDRSRDDLARRIAARTEELLAGGMIEEARDLLARGIDPAAPVFRAHGYPEVAEHLAGRLTRAGLSERLTRVTLQYSKRQRTWFRRLPGAHWIEITPDEAPEVTAARVLEALNRPANALEPGEDIT
jgi:tRNA dimethylallyltransferase